MSEVRLIDANALKEWLVAQIDYYKKYSGYNCNAMASAYGAILERIDNEPTVDAVPVVRCKDCRWGKQACGNIECTVDIGSTWAEYHDYEWFCPNGERR